MHRRKSPTTEPLGPQIQPLVMRLLCFTGIYELLTIVELLADGCAVPEAEHPVPVVSRCHECLYCLDPAIHHSCVQ